jgi:uncharacterized protein with HEPN domain
MSERDWKLFVFDILESINKIERYIEGMDYELFDKTDQTKDAVVRNLEMNMSTFGIHKLGWLMVRT